MVTERNQGDWSGGNGKKVILSKKRVCRTLWLTTYKGQKDEVRDCWWVFKWIVYPLFLQWAEVLSWWEFLRPLPLWGFGYKDSHRILHIVTFMAMIYYSKRDTRILARGKGTKSEGNQARASKSPLSWVLQDGSPEPRSSGFFIKSHRHTLSVCTETADSRRKVGVQYKMHVCTNNLGILIS